MTRKFCPLVTNNIELTTQGEMTPCCISSKRFSIDGKKANAYTNTITEVINSSDRKEWIDNFDSHFEKDCTQCYDVEKSGGESKRTREIKLWKDNLGFEQDMLQSIDLKMGNTCNLACAICGSHSSSKWGSIDKQFGIKYTPAPKWQDTDEFWEELNLHANNLKRVELAGGEPFMIKKQKILIEFLVKRDLAKNIEITWFTNCTIWPEELVKYFKEFKLVRIMLSLDNTHEKFEFQRYPGKWEETYEVFKKFISIRDEGLCQVEISHSVSALNIFDLPDFHVWCSEHNVKVFNNIVTHPFNSIDLPEEFKQRIRLKFENHKLDDCQINPIIGNDNWLIRIMNGTGDISNLRSKLDYSRRTRPGLFEVAFPELVEYIDEQI